MIHHFTSYWVILGFTEVRLWEALVKSAGWICIAAVLYCHARRKDHCLGTLLFGLSLATAILGINHFVVACSLWISPVPNIARAGVSIAGALGAIGVWFIAVVAIGTYHPVGWMLARWTEAQRLANVAESKERRRRRSLWRRRETATHGVV